MKSPVDLSPEPQHGTSRRTVLKAAGHAAWMIPAVQIASQVPAMASASDILTVGNNGTYSGLSAILTSVSLHSTSVHNGSPGAAATGLMATLTVTTTAQSTKFSNISASGWTPTGDVRSGSGNQTHTMTFSHDGAAPAAGSDTLFEPKWTMNKTTGVNITGILFEATGFVSATALPTKTL